MVESNTSKDSFLVQHTDFSLREQVKYTNGGVSNFYDNGIDMVIIDENICTMYEYFDIFLNRMLMCRKASNCLGLQFQLNINGQQLI